MMEVTFEALREAGVRLPKQVGAAVSIVGALVIGQAAVQAESGFCSNGHCCCDYRSFVLYGATLYARNCVKECYAFLSFCLLERWVCLEVMLGVITIVVHLCTLRSLGFHT